MVSNISCLMANVPLQTNCIKIKYISLLLSNLCTHYLHWFFFTFAKTTLSTCSNAESTVICWLILVQTFSQLRCLLRHVHFTQQPKTLETLQTQTTLLYSPSTEVAVLNHSTTEPGDRGYRGRAKIWATDYPLGDQSASILRVWKGSELKWQS